MNNYKKGFKGTDSDGYTYEIIFAYSMNYYLSELDEQKYAVKIISPFDSEETTCMTGSRLYDYLNN